MTNEQRADAFRAWRNIQRYGEPDDPLPASRRFTAEEAERRIMTVFRQDEHWRRYRDDWMRDLP